jgi:hypothetical protein
MSHLGPGEDFSAIETLWQASGPASSEGLVANWLVAMRAELTVQRYREANRFYWAMAAVLLLGWHLALAAGWSSSLACASPPTHEQVVGGFTPPAWQAMLTDLEGAGRRPSPERF